MAKGRIRHDWDQASLIIFAIQSQTYVIANMFRGEGDERPMEPPKLFEFHPLRDAIDENDKIEADPNLTRMAALAMLPVDQQAAAFKDLIGSITDEHSTIDPVRPSRHPAEAP